MSAQVSKIFSSLYKRLNSIQSAIVITILIGVTIPASIISYQYHNLLEKQMASELQAGLENTASLLANSVTTPLWNVAESEAQFFLDAAFSDERIFEIKVLRFDGKLFVTKRRSETLPEFHATYKLDVIRDSEKLGELVLTMDNGFRYFQLQQLIKRDITNVVQILVGSLILILLLLRIRILSPIYRLVDASNSLENRDFTVPISVGRSDEIGKLARSMENSRKALASSFSELEDQVAQRTSELTEALSYSKTILLSSPLPMVICTSEGCCVEINDAYGQLIYGDPDVRLPMKINDSNVWTNTEMLTAFERALSANTTQIIEAQITTPIAGERWLECRVLPIKFSNEIRILIQLIDLTERKQHEESLKELAFNDALTGLPNRRLLLDRIAQALRNRKRDHSYGAILFLDLNKFKLLNDIHGHDAGDAMLIEVARRLQHVTRSTDTVARLGGDEFVVLLENLGTNGIKAGELSTRMAKKIRQALTETYFLDGLDYHAGVSIGAKVFSGENTDAGQLIKEADMFMYEEKFSRAGNGN